MNSLEIRNFAREDLHGYYELYRAVMSLKPWDQPEPESELRRLLVDNPFYSPARHFIAFSGEKMVGSAWALINPAYLERHGNYPYVDVMVHPLHRRTGLGTALLSKIRKKVE
ncbi:MAG: GNAT family N-acetyltransferase, partial [Candidatus Thermoplasmatota archaeon]|nr:GNAT family N-acetyltransferase [Candidatus Thermoplasmatota archaeon]